MTSSLVCRRSFFRGPPSRRPLPSPSNPRTVNVKAWTAAGLVEFSVGFFVHVGSRKAPVAGITAHPDGDWMAQQARNLNVLLDGQDHQPSYLPRDRDSKFTGQFDA